MPTQLALLKAAIRAENYRDAVKLAASWGKRGLGGGAHAEAITKAWAAYVHPRFYIETGQNPDELIKAGIAAIRERYGING